VSASRELLYRLDHVAARIEDGFITFAHGAISLLVLAAVVLRYVFNDPLTWGEELIVGLLTWMVFIGAAAAVRSHMHIRIDVMAAVYRRPGMHWLNTVTLLLGLVILAVMVYACVEQVIQEASVELPMLGASKAWFLTAMPVGLVLMGLHAVRIWVQQGAAMVFRGETETLVEEEGVLP